ncbi:IS3 family transposase [Lonepinella sp. MS14435]
MNFLLRKILNKHKEIKDYINYYNNEQIQVKLKKLYLR